MKLIQTTAIFFLFTAIMFSTVSCNRDKDLFVRKEYTKLDIPLTGALNVPQSNSSALGSMDLYYNTTTKTLNYTVRWSGLSSPITTSVVSNRTVLTGMSIHGMAPAGFPANPIQMFTLEGITRCATFSNTTCGTYSGRLIADGVLVTQENLLNGVYYLNIRTNSFPLGELRAQIKF